MADIAQARELGRTKAIAVLLLNQLKRSPEDTIVFSLEIITIGGLKYAPVADPRVQSKYSLAEPCHYAAAQ